MLESGHRIFYINRLGLVRGHDVTQEGHHDYQPLRPGTRQRAVRLHFEELAESTSSKAAALRAAEATIGIKTSTTRNWVRAEYKKVDIAVEQSDAENNAELITLRKENARFKEANEILKLASTFSPRQSSTAN